MKEDEFSDWALELDRRLFEFQVKPAYPTQAEYWRHRNCIMYDYEILRLRKFNNPCKGCGLPLHLTNNFVIVGIGQVCGLCHTMHTIISMNQYFVALHRAAQGDKRRRYD